MDGSNPCEHVLTHLRDALASDARVGEIGIEAVHRHGPDGDHIVLYGSVSTEERRRGIDAVVAEVLSGYEMSCTVMNRTEVPGHDAPQPDEAETL